MVCPGGNQNGTADAAATAIRPFVTVRCRPHAPTADTAYQACIAAASAGEGYGELPATRDGICDRDAAVTLCCRLPMNASATTRAPAAVALPLSRSAAEPVDNSVTAGTAAGASTVTATPSGQPPSIRDNG